MAKIHALADVQSTHIGEGTQVWQYSVILKDAIIGKDCNICAHTFIENDVQIGDNCTLKSGVFLWDGVTLENSVFIGPNATFTNDKEPRSKVYPESFPRTLIKENASIGANATILPGVVVGRHALIGAGSVVTKSVPDFAVVVGNPAKVIRYVNQG